ncbi:hypothetical protein [Enterococcus sp. LJL90]
MEKNSRLAYYFFKKYFSFFVVPVILLTCFLPVVVGMENLVTSQAAIVLERFFTLIGVVLFVPLFLLDEQQNILQVVRTKETAYSQILIIRLAEILAMIAVSLLLFLGILKINQSTFDFINFFLAEFATVIFLGGLTCFLWSIFRQMIPSLMVTIGYFVICLTSSKDQLGPFYLFTLVSEDWQSKQLLFAAGVILLAVSIFLANRITSRR